MPKLSDSQLPAYRLHKQSGQAIVTLSGKDTLLGPHGTPASRAEYRRVTAEWLAAGRTQGEPTTRTVVELIAAFWKHAKVHYRKPDGTPTNEIDNFRDALKVLRRLYGRTQVHEFGPLSLRTLR